MDQKTRERYAAILDKIQELLANPTEHNRKQVELHLQLAAEVRMGMVASMGSSPDCDACEYKQIITGEEPKRERLLVPRHVHEALDKITHGKDKDLHTDDLAQIAAIANLHRADGLKYLLVIEEE